MTGTDLCVRLYKSVPVIFEPPCSIYTQGANVAAECGPMVQNTPQYNRHTLAFWNPTPYRTDTSYDLKHPSLQGYTSDSGTPLDTFYDLEPLFIIARIHLEF